MSLPAAIRPLESTAFRWLWTASFIANMTMWMHDVTAAWLMTTLTTSPAMVALVQTAATLPVFLLGVPSGALADILDRRRYFAATQLWASTVAMALAALALAGALTPSMLLWFTFANGVALAMRWPVFAAIVPTVVAREQLPQALALGGISMNLSRVVGPVLAGALIALAGPVVVFVFNAVLAAVAFTLILRWRLAPRASTLPGERFLGAMRVGLVYARQSPRLKLILLRVFLFFLQSAGLMALLPLVARDLHGGGPTTFTLMLSCVGGGAIAAALLFPRLRARFGRDQFVVGGTLIHAALCTLIVALPEIWVAMPAMFVLGMCWISVANTLTVAAQTALPDWVRARGMSIYQMALMGGSAAGSLLWGQVAGAIGVSAAVACTAAFGVLVVVATRRLSLEGGMAFDFSPASLVSPLPEAVDVGPEDGPVMVTIEYEIDAARADEFAEVMQRTRRARLRQGALSWGLFRDAARPGCYIEYFVDENWVEHQRRLERFTAFDAELRQQRLALHVGAQPPLLRRFIADQHVPPPHRPL